MPFAIEICHGHLALKGRYWPFRFMVLIKFFLAELMLNPTQNLVLFPWRQDSDLLTLLLSQFIWLNFTGKFAQLIIKDYGALIFGAHNVNFLCTKLFDHLINIYPSFPSVVFKPRLNQNLKFN